MHKTVIKRVLVMLFLSYSLFLFLPGCGGTEGDSGYSSDPSANSITLTWQVPERNSDGSPFTDLAGFKIYYGFETRTYTGIRYVAGQDFCVIDGLPNDTMIYLAVTTYDTSGNESDFSDELQTYLPPL
jgi:hypothetical protein